MRIAKSRKRANRGQTLLPFHAFPFYSPHSYLSRLIIRFSAASASTITLINFFSPALFGSPFYYSLYLRPLNYLPLRSMSMKAGRLSQPDLTTFSLSLSLQSLSSRMQAPFEFEGTFTARKMAFGVVWPGCLALLLARAQS